MLVVLWEGVVIVYYYKFYLYDVFVMQEFWWVDFGQQILLVIEVVGLCVGLMICYDFCFLELVFLLVLNGVQLLVLFVVWVKGLQKEYYWVMLLVVCVFDIICYIVVVGECGMCNIGLSCIVDLLGIILVGVGSELQLIFVDFLVDDFVCVCECLLVLWN